MENSEKKSLLFRLNACREEISIRHTGTLSVPETIGLGLDKHRKILQ